MTQKAQVLKALTVAGSRGVTNSQLNEICFRYSARIDELRKEGFVIGKSRIGPGLYRYELEPSGREVPDSRPEGSPFVAQELHPAPDGECDRDAQRSVRPVAGQGDVHVKRDTGNLAARGIDRASGASVRQALPLDSLFDSESQPTGPLSAVTGRPLDWRKRAA